MNFNLNKIVTESYNFDLDNDIEDVSVSDTIYPVKQKINKDSLQKDKAQLLQIYYEKHPRIKVGDILYDNFTRDENGELLSLGDKSGKPIGICCIQPDFLPDREARFIAFDEFESRWGKYKKLSSLICINQILTKAGLNKYGYLYSDKFQGSYIDTNEKYNISNPYLDVNKFNKEWLTPNQMLSDLQGWKNQEIILKQQGISGDFACQKCYNYKTKNTKKGQWYLPSAGELAIMFAKFNVLNDIDSFFNSNNFYWSSTQYNSNRAYHFDTCNGYILDYYKDDSLQVRPFFHITLASNFRKEKLNESFNFDLDNDIEDVSISNTIYPVKQRINKDKLSITKKQSLQRYLDKQLKNYLYTDTILSQTLLGLINKGAIYHADDLKLLGQLIKKVVNILGDECDLNWIDVSKMTDLHGLFVNAQHFNGDISKWNVSNVTDMNNLFFYSDFKGDISNWNVSNVKSMVGMFKGSFFNGDISKWNVSNVIYMQRMFEASEFNRDISEWNVSNVINMSFMFGNSIFNSNISKWNVSKVQNMNNMFEYSLFNQDISNWNIKTKNTDKMFYHSRIYPQFKPR